LVGCGDPFLDRLLVGHSLSFFAGLFGNPAFVVVQNDLTGNIAVSEEMTQVESCC
jgi:hypothetical protein